MRHIHAYSIMENGKLNEEKLEKMIGGAELWVHRRYYLARKGMFDLDE